MRGRLRFRPRIHRCISRAQMEVKKFPQIFGGLWWETSDSGMDVHDPCTFAARGDVPCPKPKSTETQVKNPLLPALIAYGVLPLTSRAVLQAI